MTKPQALVQAERILCKSLATNRGDFELFRVLKVRDFSVIVTAASVGLLVLAMFLASRRVLGAMSAPLAAGPLLVTAIVMLLCVWCGRLFARDKSADVANPPTAQFTHWLAWTPFAALLLVAFACSFPFTRFVDWLVWLPTFAAAWLVTAKVQVERRHPTQALRVLADTPVNESATSEHVLQQLTRLRTADGETIRGTLTAEFTPGQRAATVYVGFCPPFERLPEIDTEIDGEDPSANVSVVQLQHNGAQLEVRLARPAAVETRISVAFFAAESSPC